MGNRPSENESARTNFNTLNRSNRSRREERRRKQRKVLLIACVTFILLLCLSLFLIVSSIYTKVQTDKPPEESKDAPVIPPVSSETVTVTANDVWRGSLILVDSYHEYNFSANTDITRHLVNIDSNSDHFMLGYHSSVYEPKQLNAAAYTSFKDMAKTLAEDLGHSDLYVVSAYRSKDDQQQINPAYANTSEYLTGYEIGLKIWDPVTGDQNKFHMYKDKPEYGEWFDNNAHRFGYIHSDLDDVMSSKQQNFRYIGVPHATYMYLHNIDNLTDYLKKLRTETSVGGEHLEVTVDGSHYEIFYVPASSGDTEITIPGGALNHEISGDNLGGLIVTCQMS